MSSGCLQEVKDNGKLQNYHADKWSQLLMRGDRLQEVYSWGFDWEDFGVLDRWRLKEVVNYTRCLHNHGGLTVLLQVSKM